MTRMPSPACRQGGLTLVELMVAITLGLLITAVVGYLFVGSFSTYRTQSDSARLQETARFVMDLMGRDIAQAGYSDIPTGYSVGWNGFTGTPITGEDGVVAARAAERKAGTDYVRLSFDGTTDCAGNAVAVNPVVNEYYVNTNNQLMCAGSGGAGQVFAEGVEDMQLVYGVDTNGDKTVDQYTASPSWGQVLTAQVCLVMRTQNDGVTTQAQTYQNCAGGNTVATDRRLRRMLTVTHQLRNRGA